MLMQLCLESAGAALSLALCVHAFRRFQRIAENDLNHIPLVTSLALVEALGGDVQAALRKYVATVLSVHAIACYVALYFLYDKMVALKCLYVACILFQLYCKLDHVLQALEWLAANHKPEPHATNATAAPGSSPTRTLNASA